MLRSGMAAPSRNISMAAMKARNASENKTQ